MDRFIGIIGKHPINISFTQSQKDRVQELISYFALEEIANIN